jgi:hypothetical protein
MVYYDDIFSENSKQVYIYSEKKGFFLSVIYRLSQQSILETTLVENVMPYTKEI